MYSRILIPLDGSTVAEGALVHAISMADLFGAELASCAPLFSRRCQAGISASYLNQPIEVTALRQRLGHLVGLSGFPQLLLRMGYGPEVHPPLAAA